MLKKVVSAAIIAALALSVAACGGGDKKDAPKDGAKPAATAAPAKVDRSKEFITVLTGPTSGIYFPIGGAFSKVVGEMGYKTSAANLLCVWRRRQHYQRFKLHPLAAFVYQDCSDSNFAIVTFRLL